MDPEDAGVRTGGLGRKQFDGQRRGRSDHLLVSHHPVERRGRLDQLQDARAYAADVKGVPAETDVEVGQVGKLRIQRRGGHRSIPDVDAVTAARFG
jgi:hypothetical protein